VAGNGEGKVGQGAGGGEIFMKASDGIMVWGRWWAPRRRRGDDGLCARSS
jgi:hypothetical protein